MGLAHYVRAIEEIETNEMRRVSKEIRRRTQGRAVKGSQAAQRPKARDKKAGSVLSQRYQGGQELYEHKRERREN